MSKEIQKSGSEVHSFLVSRFIILFPPAMAGLQLVSNDPMTQHIPDSEAHLFFGRLPLFFSMTLNIT